MSLPHGKLEVLKVCMVIIRAIHYPLNPAGIPHCSLSLFLAKTALRASFTVMQCGRLSKFDIPPISGERLTYRKLKNQSIPLSTPYAT